MPRVVTIQAALLALGLTAGAGGQTLRYLDDPSLGEFIDISTTGEPLMLGDDEETTLGIGTFKGNFVILPGTIVVGINGGLGFGNRTTTDLAPVNQEIPSKDAFIGGQATLAYWDDIDDKEGDVYFLRLVNDPEFGNRLIVQWDSANFDGTGTTLKFQVHILDNFSPTGIYAQFMYDIEGPGTGAGSSATIGYQDGDAAFGDVQVSFNTKDAVGDGTVLSLMIPHPADLDADGVIGMNDLLLLLASWGPCPDCDTPATCPADLDGDCVVGISDLLIVLANWG